MDQRTKIKVVISTVGLIIGLIALYAFVAVIDVFGGWRIALIVIAIGWIVSGISNLIGYFKQNKRN